MTGPPKKPEPVTVLESGTPSIAIGGAPVVGGDQALVIRARADAWLEARGPDGTIYFSDASQRFGIAEVDDAGADDLDDPESEALAGR